MVAAMLSSSTPFINSTCRSGLGSEVAGRVSLQDAEHGFEGQKCQVGRRDRVPRNLAVLGTRLTLPYWWPCWPSLANVPIKYVLRRNENQRQLDGLNHKTSWQSKE